MNQNTKAIDVINELKQYACSVDVYDPWANKEEVKHEYNLELTPSVLIIKLVY